MGRGRLTVGSREPTTWSTDTIIRRVELGDSSFVNQRGMLFPFLRHDFNVLLSRVSRDDHSDVDDCPLLISALPLSPHFGSQLYYPRHRQTIADYICRARPTICFRMTNIEGRRDKTSYQTAITFEFTLPNACYYDYDRNVPNRGTRGRAS